MKSAKKSFSKMILAALKRGERLTVRDAFLRWGHMTLTQRVSELKKAGYNIKVEMIRADGTTFARYYMAI
ncbi:helix-turn-helix domain-containing protein [Aliiruegeria sabulilitoris]|uniref:helix-turn-helix domain-containing protein n=1 Tax=Aliiruegeria sabulilitoris TaxID=1510458 RepID=UPI0008354B71|nr:helix-turn-helix domain-containing protein [Aliiruegeria sabulilitoris]NDR58327.1 hypothetical protein [Pseudoruegeria sp. M32A2M]